MMTDEKVLKFINDRIRDADSKTIFANRLMYGMTGDKSYLKEVVETSNIYKEFYAHLKEHNEKRIIYGIGDLGKDFIRQYSEDFLFNNIIDGNRYGFQYSGIDVLRADDLLETYGGEMIYVCAWNQHGEIVRSLIEKGVPGEKIVDVSDRIRQTWDEWQYFDLPEMRPAEGEVFIDGGCYDAGNSQNFIKWCGGKYKQIYAFEPEKDNYIRCRERLDGIALGKYQIFRKGLWSEDTKLHFVMSDDAGGAVDANAEDVIEVTSIDGSVADKATFIKFDIEGSEREAILGAKKQITANKPKLAICVYHKNDDIYEIPRMILEMDPDYRLYFRHYSLNEWETVMYAL